MKNTLLIMAVLSGIGLSACDKPTVDKTPDAILVPVPIAGPAGATGASGETGKTGEVGATGNMGDKGETGTTGDKGNAGEMGATGDTGKTGQSGDEGIQGKPGEPINDKNIITPPPRGDMPADIVPEPSSVKPVN